MSFLGNHYPTIDFEFVIPRNKTETLTLMDYTDKMVFDYNITLLME